MPQPKMNLPHSQATNNEASPEKRHNDNSTKLYNFKEMVIGTYIYSATISLPTSEEGGTYLPRWSTEITNKLLDMTL